MSIIQITAVHPNDAFYTADPESPESILGTICQVTNQTEFFPSTSDAAFTSIDRLTVLKWAQSYLQDEKDLGFTCFHAVQYKVLFR